MRVKTVPDDPELVDLEAEASELVERFSNQAFSVLAELTAEAESAQLAKRFNRDRDPEDIFKRLSGCIAAGTVEAVQAEGEAGSKRVQLLSNLVRLRGELLDVSARLRTVCLDLRMSQHDWE